MKLIIQIPCFNEELTLPSTLGDLPREIEGIERVEWLVIDDGSTDRTVEVAREHGVHHVVRLTNNRGLAAAFQAGLDASLKLGADIIVNTDADNQYFGGDIPKLVAPILAGNADMVIGDRKTDQIDHFSPLKKRLQRLGSAVVRRASGTNVPDTTSGFRAYNREAALQMQVVSKFTYTLESIIQAGKMLVAVDHVPIRTNEKTRESRLFPSMWAYVRRNTVSIFRIYAMYEPLRVFMAAAAVAALVGRGDLGALPLLLLLLGRPRPAHPVAHPGLDDVHRRRAARRARRDRRHPRRDARAPAARARAGQARGTAPRRGAVALRAGRRRHRPGGHHRRAGRTRHRQDRGPRGAEAVSGGATAAEVPTGNTFDKYGSSNPVVKRLMGGFHSTLDELWQKAAPSSVLDVGCGEGVLTVEWAERLGGGRIVGIDLEDPKLRAEWEKRERPNLEFRAEEATRLSFSDDEFDLASAIEVLEHVPEPEATLAEMARVARGHLLVSVPREPLWRGLNMARGAYWRDLGNTPGHVNHWSKRGFVSLLSRYGTVEEARSPFPWTMLLVRL